MITLLAVFYVLTPVLILYLCNRFPFFNKIGAITIAYIVGLIIGNLGILPEGSNKVQEYVTMITIPIAIPLLLFSTNVKDWFKLAGKTLISLALALVAILATVSIGFFIFREENIPEFWKIPGMLIGVYTGGTPNLASLKIMLDIDSDIYIVTHSYDMLLSAIYLIFLITIGKRTLLLILPSYQSIKKSNNSQVLNNIDSYEGIFKKKILIPLLIALFTSIIIFGIAGLSTLILPTNSVMPIVILIITSLGISASLIPSINKIEKSFELGMFFILIFSLDVASMANISNFLEVIPGLLKFITLAVFGSLFLHVLLSRLFKIDTDTTIITSTALICSPPFVPLVAGVLKNKEVIVSGLTVGIIGYAIGNYLGFFTSEILKTFY